MIKFLEVRDRYLPILEGTLSQFLSAQATLSAQMAEYHLKTGGKRLRSLIPIFIYENFKQDVYSILPFAAAVEMVHNATLVHDDLQDGDEFRRHQDTVWKKYSPAQAINCGNAMFQYAFQLVLKCRLETNKVLELLDFTTQSALQVIEGQAQEFQMKEEEFPGIRRYIEVSRGKTSGLFVLPVVGTLKTLNLDQKACAMAQGIAMDLGVLFQIQDDLIDVYGDKGRQTRAADIAEGKISFFVAFVNEVGSPADKQELCEILKKPREKTSENDIRRAIALFEKYSSKENAIAFVNKIRKSIEENSELSEYPRIQDILRELKRSF